MSHHSFCFLYYSAKTEEGKTTFGHYGGYPAWPFQALGVLPVVLAICVVLVGAAAPRLYAGFSPSTSGGKEEDTVEGGSDEDVEETMNYTELAERTESRILT